MRCLSRAFCSARRLLLHTVAGIITMCAGVSSVVVPTSVIKLPAVQGSEPDKRNDVLLCLSREPVLRPHHVVYFPGDVQNYRDVMLSHAENFRWNHWSLEDIAGILSHRFPSSYIWIVKSSRMHLHKFSCYDNFVDSNMFGAPNHTTELGAFKQLHALLVHAFTRAQHVLIERTSKYGIKRDYNLPVSDMGATYTTYGSPSEKDITNHCTENSANHHADNSTTNFGFPAVKDSVSITLIGFSKGCVVLNQLLHELEDAKKHKDLHYFIYNIKDMYWLDGGHSGGIDTWVTSPEILKVFAETGIVVHTHVTPYQIRDPMRSWIGKEHSKFVQMLKENNMSVESQVHFSYEMPSLENHFRVHDVF
ncbi:mitochondrial protein C2orf69 homolog [Bombina bombina]|uniref:mitochondrial protein C2orf69 homolog n=1 Tax=Bombina bombina TaxID=8345 RepID=UPI00235A88D4|nr:mitochondrial protein C2orf69 homolog [Bombina bombina]